MTGVIGAIDGCYVLIDAPQVDAQYYRTRKCEYAITLQAVCDPELRFTDVFAGYPGSVGDLLVMSTIPVFNKNLHAYLTDEAGNMVQSDRGYYVAIDLQDQSVIEVYLPDTEMSSATDCEHSPPFLDNLKENEDIDIQAATVQPSTSSTVLPLEGNSQLKKSRRKVSGAQGTASLFNKPPASQTASNVAMWTSDHLVVRSLIHFWSAN
ncbi:uncharacterized protein [Temnothorax nylanderi]|uniref:uncharacterized protein isoform X1 n=1 Tax=Temnothorax nylanderi TaxID=102681 RepID=UPI003A860846